MAQDPQYGAAQPIVDVAKKFYDTVTGFGGKPAPKAEDDGTHARMVKEANDSFRSAADKAKSVMAGAAKPSVKSAAKAQVPGYKDGIDRVPKTGIAKLHKDEAVLNKKDADKYREGKGMSRAKAAMSGGHKSGGKKSSGKPVHEMHIKRAHSGGFSVRHHYKQTPGQMMDEPTDHVVPDVDALQDHLAQNMGDQPPAGTEPAPQPAPAASPSMGM